MRTICDTIKYTKKYLQQAYRLNELIDSNQEELDHLDSLVTRITPKLNLVQVEGSSEPDRLGDTVAKIVDLQNFINSEIDRYVALKAEIAEKIAAVENMDQQLLLRCRYLNFLTWEEIAVKMHYSYRNIHYIHNDALHSFEALHRIAQSPVVKW